MKRIRIEILLSFPCIITSIVVPFILITSWTPSSAEEDFQAIDSAVRMRVREGLEFLKKSQSSVGGFTGHFEVAITSLACLAFMASGSTPSRGPYAREISSGLKFILQKQQASGYITESIRSESRMHGHGYATLFLAEAYGMTGTDDQLTPEQEELKRCLIKAVRVIESSQTALGGWGYEPAGRFGEASWDEASVTVCQVQALRSARNAGIKVNDRTVEKGLEYLRKCALPDGSFKYSLQLGLDHSSLALTGAAVSALNSFGDYDSQEVRNGREYILRHKPGGGPFYYYELFYTTQAMYHAGGTYWKRWFKSVRSSLLERYASDKWDSEFGRVFGTAFSCLTLQIPKEYLPIFQR